MVKIIDDKCWDSADWVEHILGKEYRPKKDVITYDELNEICDSLSLGDDRMASHWDYPLTEIEMLQDEDHDGTEVVLVRFDNKNGNYDYRLCEI